MIKDQFAMFPPGSSLQKSVLLCGLAWEVSNLQCVRDRNQINSVMWVGCGNKLRYKKVNWLPRVILSYFICSNWFALINYIACTSVVMLHWHLIKPCLLSFPLSLIMQQVCELPFSSLVGKWESVSWWLYLFYTSLVRAACKQPGLGHRDLFVVPEVDSA